MSTHTHRLRRSESESVTSSLRERERRQRHEQDYRHDSSEAQSPTSPPVIDRRNGHRNLMRNDLYDPSNHTSSDSHSYGKVADRRRTTKSRRSDRTHELVRLLVAEERDSRDAMRALHRTSQLLEDEKQRNDDLERRLAEATERWKSVNSARLQAQQEATRITEELRLYKLQFESAQQQIVRANELIAQSDKEKIEAAEAAEKARGMVRKLQEERLVRTAREDGLRVGRDEGRKEGLKLGFERARDQAYLDAREEAMRQLDNWLERQGFPGGTGYAGREDGEDDEEELMQPIDEEGEDDLYERDHPPPSSQPSVQPRSQPRSQPRQPPPASASEQHAREMNIQHQRQHSEPTPVRSSFEPSAHPMPVARVHRDIPPPRPVMPPPQHAEPPSHVPTPLHGRSESISIPEFSSRLPNRSSSQRSGKSLLGRFFRNAFHSTRDTPTDPNVRINLNAPDAGDIIDDRPQRVTATPLPISAPGHMRAASPMMHMPEVDHNPDPRNVPPIVDSTTPRTPAHRHVAIPPEGYIPQLDENGGIGLPPPHELEKPPPTPGLGMDAAALPVAGQSPALLSKERQSHHYENQGTGLPSSSRVYPIPPHAYQESVVSEATSQYSILTPPQAIKGVASASRLSAIPESQTPSPYHGDVTRRLSQEQFGSGGVVGAGPGPSSRPMSRASGRGSMREHRDDFIEHRQRIADELKDPDYNASQHGTPRHSETMTPRSVRSSFSHGPRRPSRITTPALLADQAYSRPRRDSVNSSERYSDGRSLYGGGPGSARGHHQALSISDAGEVPDINIQPPSSRSDSRTSQPRQGYASDSDSGQHTPVVPDTIPRIPSPNLSPRMSSSPLPGGGIPIHQPVTVAGPAQPIPNLPGGFVPGSVVSANTTPHQHIPSLPGIPTGFIPTGIAGTPGFSSPLSQAQAPGLPTGFVPTGVMGTPGLGMTSPLPPTTGLPAGFIPTGRSDEHRDSTGIGVVSPHAGSLPIPPPSIAGSERNRRGHSREGAWDWEDDVDDFGSNPQQGAALPIIPGSVHSPRPILANLSASGPTSATPRPISPSLRRMSGGASRTPSPNASAIPLPPPGATGGFFVPAEAFVAPSPMIPNAGFVRSNTGSIDAERPHSPLPMWAPSNGSGSRPPPGFVADPLAIMLPSSHTSSRAPSAGLGSGGHISRPISPRPQLGESFSRSASPRPVFSDEPTPVPAPINSPQSRGLRRSMSHSSSRPHTPAVGFAQTGSVRSGGHNSGEGMPPGSLTSPFSRRLSLSQHADDGPVYPVRTASRASSRGGQGGGTETPRSSRVYPRTPLYAPASIGVGRSGAQDDPVIPTVPTTPVGGFVSLDRPMHGFTDRGEGASTNNAIAGDEIKRSASRASARSVRSTGSIKPFDPSTYVDAAFLATGSAENSFGAVPVSGQPSGQSQQEEDEDEGGGGGGWAKAAGGGKKKKKKRR